MLLRLEQFTLVRSPGANPFGPAAYPTIYSLDYARFDFDAVIVAICVSSNIIITDASLRGIFCVAKIGNFVLDPAGTGAIVGSLSPAFTSGIGALQNTDVLINHFVIASSLASLADPFVSNKAQILVYPKELRPEMKSGTGVGIFIVGDTSVDAEGTATIYYHRLTPNA